MHNAIANRICKDRITDLFSPTGDIKLRAEDRRSIFVSNLCNLKEISCLCFFERIKEPFVKNEKCRLLLLLNHFSVYTVTACYSEFGKQLRQPHISDGEKIADSSHSQRAGKIYFSTASSAEDHNVISF